MLTDISDIRILRGPLQIAQTSLRAQLGLFGCLHWFLRVVHIPRLAGRRQRSPGHFRCGRLGGRDVAGD